MSKLLNEKYLKDIKRTSFISKLGLGIWGR